MEILQPGLCPISGEQIYEFKRPKFLSIYNGGFQLNFKKVPFRLNDKGCLVWFLLSDGTKMAVSVSKTTKKHLTMAQAEYIQSQIVWTNLVKSLRTIEKKENGWRLFDRLRTVEVFKFFDTEDDCDAYLKGKQKKGKKDGEKINRNTRAKKSARNKKS